MANKTTNYNLTKPSSEDFYNVEDQNGNMDIIDAELKKLNDGKAPSGHGLGDVVTSGHGDLLSFMKKGCGFYSPGNAEDSPHDSSDWLNLLQLVRDEQEGLETGAQMAFRDFEVANPKMWLRTLWNGNVGAWVELLHTGNLYNLGVPKVITGSYVGTGTYGKNNPNSITFDFEPKLVILQEDATVIMIRGTSKATYYTTTSYSLTLTWSGNVLSWYSTESAGRQFNTSGETYHWVAIG